MCAQLVIEGDDGLGISQRTEYVSDHDSDSANTLDTKCVFYSRDKKDETLEARK